MKAGLEKETVVYVLLAKVCCSFCIFKNVLASVCNQFQNNNLFVPRICHSGQTRYFVG